MKKCIKCGEEKDPSEFYGVQGDCKSCTKERVKKRTEEKMKDPEFAEKERERSREKYHRLNYKEKSKNWERTSSREYRKKYPEKYSATIASQRIESLNGHNHHWSYNQEHWKDVIDLTIEQHRKAHRFMIYDQERMMYRRIDTNELLDTREKHIEYINSL